MTFQMISIVSRSLQSKFIDHWRNTPTGNTTDRVVAEVTCKVRLEKGWLPSPVGGFWIKPRRHSWAKAKVSWSPFLSNYRGISRSFIEIGMYDVWPLKFKKKLYKSEKNENYLDEQDPDTRPQWFMLIGRGIKKWRAIISVAKKEESGKMSPLFRREI